MLESIKIKNYAIIDEMTADFSGGLNVITGETGAGKSIVVDALELVFGARASAEMVRSGASTLEVTGVFTKKGNDVEELSEYFEDGVLILKREVRNDSASRCFINGNPVTLKTFREIGTMLVDFHGQHDQQSLLMVPQHVKFLDGYAGITPLALEVAGLYRQMVSVRESIKELKERMEAASKYRELYDFQCGEIDTACVIAGEDTELDIAIKRLSMAVELKGLGETAFMELSESEGSVLERLGSISSHASSLAGSDPVLDEAIERMEELAAGVSDIAMFFRSYSDKVEDDPALLRENEERLALLERLKKKYGPTLEDVLAHRSKIGQEIEKAGVTDTELREMEEKLVSLKSSLLEKAEELSAKRKAAAPELAGEVEGHLAELGMSGAKIVIDINPCEGPELLQKEETEIGIGPGGLDRVEFLISANRGEPPRPLVKVASGGEISRIMVSLKLALMDANRVPTMVFDEIDVGVSGRVADAIGMKLQRLAENRQAIVITHLPQIAVMADRHFSARKTEHQGRVSAGLVTLDEKMSQHELAMLLSGNTLTDTALAHARELMNNRRKQQ